MTTFLNSVNIVFAVNVHPLSAARSPIRNAIYANPAKVFSDVTERPCQSRIYVAPEAGPFFLRQGIGLGMRRRGGLPYPGLGVDRIVPAR